MPPFLFLQHTFRDQTNLQQVEILDILLDITR
jgi:hypothetical protein